MYIAHTHTYKKRLFIIGRNWGALSKTFNTSFDRERKMYNSLADRIAF